MWRACAQTGHGLMARSIDAVTRFCSPKAQEQDLESSHDYISDSTVWANANHLLDR